MGRAGAAGLRVLGVFCVAGVFGVSGVFGPWSAARAEEPSASSEARTADTLAAARRHFELGEAAFAAGDYRAALRELELAVALAPNAELWFDIGRAHEELGEHAEARIAYERYLRDSVDPKDAAEVRARMARLSELSERERRERSTRATGGVLKVETSEEGALVMLDGRLLGRAPQTEPIPLAQGRYRLDVVAPARIPLRAEVEISAGTTTYAKADLAPRSSPAEVGAPARVWTWVALGLAAGGALGFGAFTAASLAEERGGDRASAARWADRADVALGGTVLCAVSSALLHFFEEQPASPEPRMAAAATTANVSRWGSAAVLDPSAALTR